MKRFLCIAILAAFALAPPIATPDMPSENIGVVQSATVSALGKYHNGTLTHGASPEAGVSANVWAGATPTAHVYPYHSDPEKVTIKVDDYAYWQGEATGTLNRSYLLPSNGEVVPEDPRDRN